MDAPADFAAGYTDDVAHYPQARGTVYVTQTHLGLRGSLTTAAAAASTAASASSTSLASAGGLNGAASPTPSSVAGTTGTGTGGGDVLISFKDVVAVERAILPGGTRAFRFRLPLSALAGSFPLAHAIAELFLDRTGRFAVIAGLAREGILVRTRQGKVLVSE